MKGSGSTTMTRQITTINPATEEVVNTYEIMTKEQIKEKTKKAQNAFTDWKKDIQKRADHLHNFAQEFRKEKEELAKLMTKEMGRPIKEARAEVDKCAWVMEYFADNGKIFLNEEVINTDARKSTVAFEPLGVIGSIMPWNFPYWQGLRFGAPSLMAGNTIVLKPASATMGCGLEIEKAFTKSGVPEGVFQTVVLDGAAADVLVDSEDINAVTFTGSVSAGGKVAQRAASQIKKCVLELGGSDPFIVCKDADIEKASSGAVKGRFVNNGQSCIATKRFVVVKDIANEFIEKFVQKTEKLKVGDPRSEDTDLGPVVNASGLKTIDSQVKDTAKEGAEILTGGEQIGSKGYFYKPTIVKNVSTHMRMAREEVFGPAAAIILADDEIEAVTLANDSQYGLGASIWTEDVDNAEKLSRLVHSGMVTVNNVVLSDPRVPFGGVKKSGFGRELSKFSMLEFVNIKSIRFYDELVHHHYVE
ncbi:MAG: NAD-dependent succinate-semialdehyde dehydrogenase [Nitrososphaeraceae archaeon]